VTGEDRLDRSDRSEDSGQNDLGLRSCSEVEEIDAVLWPPGYRARRSWYLTRQVAEAARYQPPEYRTPYVETVRTCKAPACDREVYLAGRCRVHFATLAQERAEPVEDVPRSPTAPSADPCSVAGCVKEVHARGLCGKHYAREWTRLHRERDEERVANAT
jgi:hypothetical protein